MKNAKIKLTYLDGSRGDVYTLEQLRERFKGEDSVWVEGFINQIMVQGYAYTRMGGKYELINNQNKNYSHEIAET